MLRYAHSCCVADLTITLHVAWYDDCRWSFGHPHRQHKSILVRLISDFWNFSFFVGFRARHDFRLLRKTYRSQIDLPALLPLTHTTCVTQRARVRDRPVTPRYWDVATGLGEDVGTNTAQEMVAF